jgi:hypothetical protein
MFRCTLWHFYAFSGTNLLTRCHSASFLFSAVFVFQKSYTGNILRIGQNKSQTSRNLPKLPENQKGDREGPQAGHTVGQRGPGPGRAPMCEAASVHFWRCPFAYKEPPMGKTSVPDQFSRNISRSATVVDPRSGGSRSSSRHPAGEGNRHRRSSSSPCLPPARWVSSLPWTMAP